MKRIAVNRLQELILWKIYGQKDFFYFLLIYDNRTSPFKYIDIGLMYMYTSRITVSQDVQK